MTKWGVRLIACFFFVWAIADVYKLILGTYTSGDIGLTYNGQPIYVLGWVWAGIYVYIGFHLVKFHQRGRYWALFLLWPPTIISGLFCIWVIFLSTRALYTGVSFPFDLNPKWGGEITDPIMISTIFVGIFVLCLIPTYFLMRKDVKQLFDKASAVEDNSIDIKSTPS